MTITQIAWTIGQSFQAHRQWRVSYVSYTDCLHLLIDGSILKHDIMLAQLLNNEGLNAKVK